MTKLMNDQFICFCCRNIGCDSYTIFKGYLMCEYCLDDWLKSESWRKNEDFEGWCIEMKKELSQDVISTITEPKEHHGIKIIDVKVVGLCSKCRLRQDEVPRYKDLTIIPDEDIACLCGSLGSCKHNAHPENLNLNQSEVNNRDALNGNTKEEASNKTLEQIGFQHPDSIHSSNKDLLDGDYKSKLDKWKNKRITKPKIVKFAETTNKVGDKQ